MIIAFHLERDPTAFCAIVAADKIVTANREAIEECGPTHDTVRCTFKIKPKE